MKFASLGSGSAGNATVVSIDGVQILIDCGFSVKETEKRMQRLGLSPADLSAILLTHEHGDHSKGVAPLARKYALPVYMTEGTWAAREFGRLSALQLIRDYQSFCIDQVSIFPVVVPHDAREPTQFIFESREGLCFGILTDLGSITPHIVQAYRRCHAMFVEANHDLHMLATGPYPPALKSRVSGAWGHLNNRQTADLLAQFDLERLQKIVIGHISEKNNSLQQVKQELANVIARARSVHFACQDEGFDWLQVDKPYASDAASQL